MPNIFDQFDVESEVKDLATSFGVGSNQLLKMGGDAYGLATGNMDNVVSRQGQENIDYLQRGKSKKLSDAETRRKAAVDAKSGIVDQALAYAKETFTDPRLLLSSTVEAIPSMIGAGGIGAGARAVTGRVLAKKGAQKAAEIAAKVGVGTAVAAGSGMQGTSVGAEQYSEVTDILSKMSDEKAMAVPEIARLMSENNYSLEKAKKELTLGLARSTGALATIASLATQMVPGGRTIEQALVGGAGKKLTGRGLAQRGVGVVRGLLGEPIQEGSEEGSGAFLKNLDARAVEPERDLTKGVGEAIGAGVAGTALLGAAAGTSAASHPSRPVSEGETTAGKSSEPLASDATSIPVLEATTEYPSISLRDVENMSPEEFAATIDARDAISRGAEPRPEDVTALEGMRRPPVAETDVSIAPVQEALDEWRTQNPDVGVNISVINDPNMRNTRNYGIRGYFDPNTGEVVINSAFTKPFEVESVVNHEWSHHTLSSEGGRAALVEFATRDIPKEELDALAKRYPNADNLTLVEEWIARSQEKSPGTFARIIAKIREWLNGKLGINMTNEEVARVMLRTLRERGAPVAEGSGEMRQSTTEQPLASDEPTGAASRASGIMASPSVTDIDYPRAKQNLTSSAQARFRSQIKDYAPDSAIYNAVGDWRDGAENSVAAIFNDVRPIDELKKLAAKTGLAGDQKAVLWWTTDPNGADAIHRVTWPKEVTMDQARQAMIDAGLENRTLIETPDGVQGFVFDQGRQNLNKIKDLHENSTEPSINTQPATGDFLGSWNTRVEGKRAYRAVLGRAAETETGDRGGQYDQRTGVQPEARYSVTDEPVPESGGAGSGRGGVLSSPSRMDSGTSPKTSSRQPNENVRKIADDYNAQSGQNPIEHGHYVSVDESLAQRIAKAYDALPEVDRSPETIQAYEALAKEVGDQWDFAVNNLGVTFEPWTKEGQPYANSREMVKDVRDNNHIYFFQGGDPHPFLGEVDPETGFTANDKLRAVHDLFGHAAEDYQFGPRGEENAWIKHSQMFSPEAQRALSSETRGQNSWVNFGDQNYENGVNKNIPAKDRPFAAQKTALLPEELTDWRSALGQSEPGRSILASEKPKEVIRYSLTPEQIGAIDNRRINELDIEDLVSKGILTDRHGKLLSELRDASGGDASIEVVSPEDLPPRAAAVYDPNTNTIRVSNAAKPNLGRVLMHEYTHALTFMGLKYADERMTSSGDIISATPRPGVDIRDLREASRQMDGLFSTAEKAANDLGEKFYGLTNRMEFVAEAFSSKKFQDFLSSIPSTKGGKQSLFDQFITIVKKILGTESDSLLTDVITATDPFVGAKKTKTGTLMISEDSPALPDEPSEPERSSLLAKQPIRESVTEDPVERVPEEGDPDYEEPIDTSSTLNAAAKRRERDDLPPTSALNTLYAIDSSIPLPAQGKRTNGQVAAQLREAAREHWGRDLDSSNITPEEIDGVVTNGVEEVLAGLKAGNHAGNWYTTAIRKAMAIAGILHPELNDDALAQKAGFKNAHAAEVGLATAMAITSQNLNVQKNTQYANEQFNILKKTGRFDPSKEYGSKLEAVSGNLELANSLLDRVGWDGMEDFLNKEYTVKELNDVASKLLGRKVNISGKVDDVVNGSAIFGPKIGGGFFQNLRGNFNPVTVDLWMRRTWGRWTGDVLPDPLDAKRLARMIDGMRESGIPLPEELRSIRTIVAKSGRKVSTLSDAAAERVLSNPEAVTAAYDFAAQQDSRWNKIYSEVRQNITPEQAEAVRKGSLSLEKLNRDQQKSIREKKTAWQDLEDRPSSSSKEGKAAQEKLFAEMDKAAGRTATLTNEELSDNKPEWAKSSRVIKTLLKPVDVPSDIDRRVIVDVVNRIRNELDRQGVTATNADIQAILWYPEKDLWAKLAGKKESNLKNSYDEEFLKVAESQGLGERARAAAARVGDAAP